MVSTQLRVHDPELWELFKQIARERHHSANALLNLLIEQCVDEAMAEKSDDPEFV